MKIPLGNFGNDIARNGPAPVLPGIPRAVNIPQGAFSAGEGAQRLGDAGMRVAANLIDEQAQQQAALKRTEAANILLDHEIAVKTVNQEISDQLKTGSLSYKDASEQFKSRMQDIPKPDISGMDPVTAENLARGLKRNEFIANESAGRSIKAAEVADSQGQVDLGLDKLGKLAGMPGADVAAIVAQVHTFDEQGRAVYGKNWEGKKQEFQDKVWFNHATQRVIESRNSMDGLKALEADLTSKGGALSDKLDTEKKSAIVAKVEIYKTALIQQKDAAEARAAREAERKLHNAEAEYKTFQGMADKGTILDPGYVDRALQATSGTPYQKGIVALAKQVTETGGIAAQPIAAQQAMLDGVDQLIAKNGRSPELDKRREQIAKVVDGSVSDLKEKGLRAGLERGIIAGIAPIDMNSPADMARSISERLKQADVVSRWAGVPVSPLDSHEATGLKSALDMLPPKERSAAVATVAEAVGSKSASAISAQMDAKDRPLGLAFAMAGAKTNWGRYTSELVLKGATAIKDGVVMKDDKKVTGWKATIASEIDGAFPNEQLSSATKDAAYYIAAGLAQENGGSISSSDIKKAVTLAVGGEIIERNGKRLPIPAGMDDGTFEKRLKSVSLDQVAPQITDGKVLAGGVPISAADFVKSLPGQELMYAGNGRYAVIVRGRPVVNAAGKPIIIGVQ